MFSGMIQSSGTFNALLSGGTIVVCETDERNGTMESVFTPSGSCGIPENGTHWMILNGEKFLVRVDGDSSDPEDCPCCAWWWVSFTIVG